MALPVPPAPGEPAGGNRGLDRLGDAASDDPFSTLDLQPANSLAERYIAMGCEFFETHQNRNAAGFVAVTPWWFVPGPYPWL
jgi:hypothetical protein